MADAGARPLTTTTTTTTTTMAGASLEVRVYNGTETSQSLIAFLSSPRVPAGASVYCWQGALLAAGAEWTLRVPLRFEAAGMITTETGVVVSNLEPAVGGRRFRLVQAPDEPLRIEPAGRSESATSIRIHNHVAFARRSALLLLGQRPVLGFLLGSGDDVELEPSTTLLVALRTRCEGLEVLKPPMPSVTCAFELSRGESVARLEARLVQDPITGATSCAVTGVPRERSEPAPVPS